MRNRIYTEILNDRFKALGYFADELIEATTDVEFFHLIASFFVPLIKKSAAFEQIFFRWIQERNAYTKMSKELRDQACQEIEEAYSTLKEKLKTYHFRDEIAQEIEQKIKSIQAVFANKQTYRMPSYVEFASDNIKTLLRYLFELEMYELVQEYAVLLKEDRFIEFEGMKKIHIDHFIFATSLSRLHELENEFSWRKVQKPWIAWEFFTLVEWCWYTPFSFFEGKNENYSTLESQNESMKLLGLRSHWQELDKVKHDNGESPISILFFTRTRFIAFLKIIINEIVLYQETEAVLQSSNISSVDFEVYAPISIKLRLPHEYLLLDVYWSKDSDPFTYIITRFRDGSGRHKFFRVALENPRQVIDIEKVSGVNGANVAKFLGDARLNNILGTLFFEKNENYKTYKAMLKSDEIKCADLSKTDKMDLMKHIKSTLTEYNPHYFDT